GMRKVRGGAGLAQEPVAQPTLRGELRQEDLERDGAIELDLAREIHGPHPAASELTLEDVAVAERAADGFEGERRCCSHGDEYAAGRDRRRAFVPPWPSAATVGRVPNRRPGTRACHRRTP